VRLLLGGWLLFGAPAWSQDPGNPGAGGLSAPPQRPPATAPTNPSTEVLRLEDVLLSVDAAHPMLEAARARVAASRGERMAAAGALDPTLKAKVQAKPGKWESQVVTVGVPLRAWGGDVVVGWNRGAGTFEPWEGDLATVVTGEATVSATLPLLRDSWTDRRRATRARATRDVDLAEAELRARALELRRAAASRYWDWVASGSRLRVARQLLELAETRDRAFAAQVGLGEVPAIVREDSRRLVLERTDRRIQAERALQQARIELSLHLRDPDGRRVLVQDSLLPPELSAPAQEVDLPRAQATARERRPELARLEAQRAMADIDARLQLNQTLPGLDLLGEQSVPLEGEKATWKLGAQADWTLGARPARGRLAAARATADRYAEELAFAGDRVEADVQDAASALEAARARIAVVDRLVTTAERVAEAERGKLAIGDSNLIFVNQREIAVAEAAGLVIDARLAASKAWVDLLAAQGILGD
jgi:cobalt-zinc-cadmium efflux system outer membrane protein